MEEKKKKKKKTCRIERKSEEEYILAENKSFLCYMRHYYAMTELDWWA